MNLSYCQPQVFLTRGFRQDFTLLKWNIILLNLLVILEETLWEGWHMRCSLHVPYPSFLEVIYFNCCDSFPEHSLLSPFVISLSQRFINGHYILTTLLFNFSWICFLPGADLLLVTINQWSPKRKELRLSRQTETTSANKSHWLTLSIHPWNTSDSHKV